MRSKKAIINTVFSLLEDFVAIACSFVLPKLILSHFGSEYNGLVTSITQFLACAVLLRSGIGGATRAALYRPLARHDKKEVDSILKATSIFMKKISIILVFAILGVAAIYPIIVNTEFSWLFVFSLFIIIGISTLAESFFGITYLILLQADQKLYIPSIIKIICYILNITVATILILTNNSIHIVKLGSAIVFALNPIILNIYVRKKYKIDKNAQPDNKAISQRWDAFWHQVTVFVNNNTDVMVLSIFTNMLEVSVYSVYNLVIAGLKRFIVAFTRGIDSAFGDMIAKEEKDKLKKNLSIIELIIYNIATFLISCSVLLISQFIAIYTDGITDADYSRPLFSYLLLAGLFFYAIRIPYQNITHAAGHFKQTKKYAFGEIILNIGISVILVIQFGLIGVAIGTLVATAYKTIMFSNYLSSHIVERPKLILYKRIAISVVEFLIIFGIMSLINLPKELTYGSWFFNAIVTILVAGVMIAIGIVVFYRNEVKDLAIILKNIRRRKNKNRREHEKIG